MSDPIHDALHAAADEAFAAYEDAGGGDRGPCAAALETFAAALTRRKMLTTPQPEQAFAGPGEAAEWLAFVANHPRTADPGVVLAYPHNVGFALAQVRGHTGVTRETLTKAAEAERVLREHHNLPPL